MTCGRKHLLVTGANSGIGLATAQAVSRAGWHVFAGARSVEGLAAKVDGREGGLTTGIRLDVTSPEDVEQAVGHVGDHVGDSGLDALANVAGIGVSAPLETVDIERVRAVFEVNVLGQLAVTQPMIPLLRRARGRLVMVGSIGDRLTVPYAGPLTSSKWALAALTETLRQELAPWGIRVILIEPASIHTPAVDKMHDEVARTVADFTEEQRYLYADTFRTALGNFLADEEKGSPPEIVGETILKALTVPHPRTRYLTGAGAHKLAGLATLPAPVQDAAKRKVFGLPRPGSAE